MAVELDHWVEQIRGGEARPLARALTEIENRGPRADSLLKALFPYSGKALRIGVTGAPGAGKSTLVDRLARHLRRQGRTIAIVAVDPTSPYSGGSLLGDRVRMQSHHADDGVFVRSMATRGVLGGLAPTAADVVTVLEAAGNDVVLIETVGVGQAEVDIVKWASRVALVLTPAMGDDVQTMKAGVMEIADVFVINKSDQPGADRIERQVEALLSLLPDDRPGPPIVRTVAVEDQGVDKLLDALDSLPESHARLAAGWKERLVEMVKQRMAERVLGRIDDSRLDEMARAVAEGRENPYDLVEELVGEVE